MPAVIDRLEYQLASKLGRLSTRHQQELTRLLGNPPSINNVPPEFWQRVRRETEDELAAMLLLLFIASIDALGVDRDASEALGDLFSQQRAAFVAERYTAHSQARVESASQRWAGQIADARSRAGAGPFDADDVIRPSEVLDTTTGVFGPDRAARVAETESVHAEAQAANEALKKRKSDDPIETATLTLRWELNALRVPEKNCSFCVLVDGCPKEFWGQFIEAPAAHVGCACALLFADISDCKPREQWPDVARVIAAAKESGIFGY